MRSLTTTCLSGIAAFAMLLLLGCCGDRDASGARTGAPEARPEPLAAAPAPAPQPETSSEQMGIKVSMFPLSSPPPPAPPPPALAFAEAPAYYLPPAPAYGSAPAPLGTGYQTVPPGSLLIGDPPSITLSSTGEIIDQTGTVSLPAATVYTSPSPAAAMSAPPLQTSSVSSPDPFTTVYQTTTSSTALEPVQPGSPVSIPIATTVIETRTVSSPPPAVMTPGYEPAPPPLNPVSAVYYPDAPIPAAPVSLSPTAAGGGLRLVPAPDIPPGDHPNDALPSQWFEIIRPGNGPIRIGRVSSTCVCVSPRVPNRFIGAGERALVEARIVKRPPANNLTYGLFVNTVEPVQQTLDSDITISF